MIKQLLGALLALATATCFAGVDVNQADQALLESVRGIGPSLSGKLLEERKKGPFKNWADMIDRVQGIGPGNAARFSTAGLTVGDASYAGTPAAAPKAAASPAKAKPKTDAAPR